MAGRSHKSRDDETRRASGGRRRTVSVQAGQRPAADDQARIGEEGACRKSRTITIIARACASASSKQARRRSPTTSCSRYCCFAPCPPGHTSRWRKR